MAISPNLYDRDKAAYKENIEDGGLDRRVTDVSTQSKLDDVITAIGSIGSPQPSSAYYDEVMAVASGVLTTIVTHTATTTSKLKYATVSGTNIASYEVQLNGNIIAKKYTNFGSSLSVDFDFISSINLAVNDVIRIRVLHVRNTTGDFNGTLLIEE